MTVIAGVLLRWLVVSAQLSPPAPPGKRPETVNVISLADHRTPRASRSSRAGARQEHVVSQGGW